MKYGRNVLQVNMHRLTESDFGMTSYFQDGGRDVISRRILCICGFATV